MGWFSKMPSSKDVERATANLDAAHRDAVRAREQRDADRKARSEGRR